jgi:hypothetical protein
MACFRLVTLRPELLRSVPFFFRFIADLTALLAPLPYFAMDPSKLLRCGSVETTVARLWARVVAPYG